MDEKRDGQKNCSQKLFCGNNLDGFTLIELILVVAIVSILAVSSAPFITRMIWTNNLEVAGDKMVAAIRKAQTYAMNGKGNTIWGICWYQQKVRMFSGSCSTPTYKEDYDMTGVTVSGFNEITFSGDAGRRGEPSVPLSVTVSGNLGSTTINLNNAGGMDIH
jgi:prepilin-type N-terminal cleavage/methylation domain-containing protein